MERKFLESFGLEKEAIDKILDENSADIGKAKKEVESVTAKQAEIESQLDAANKTIGDMTAKMEEMQKSGADVESMKAQLDSALQEAAAAQEAAAQDKKDYEDKLAAIEQERAEQEEKAARDTALKAFLDENGVKFTSDYNEKGFLSDFEALGLKLENNTFLGGKDYLKQRMEENPELFVPERPDPQVRFTAPGSPKPPEGETKRKTPTFF